MPKRKHNGGSQEAATEDAGAPVRSMWSGTITFGLVSIPVDLLSAVRPRQTAMKHFLAPSGRSAKAYNLLTATMEKTGRVGVGSFVMRGHQYLVAIVSDNGVLRADTLRYTDEIRTPESIGLPKAKKPAASKVTQFGKAIDDLKRTSLDMSELADQDAQALRELAESKQKKDEDVIHQRGLEEADAEATEGSAQIIDLMEVLRKSLSKNAVVTRAGGDSEPISLDERRAAKKKKTPAKRKTAQKRARRA